MKKIDRSGSIRGTKDDFANLSSIMLVLCSIFEGFNYTVTAGPSPGRMKKHYSARAFG
jgi:hypothetical protein